MKQCAYGANIVDDLKPFHTTSQNNFFFSVSIKSIKKTKERLRCAILSPDYQAWWRPKVFTFAQLSSLHSDNAPAGNWTRVCTVAGYYSTTRPLVLDIITIQCWIWNQHWLIQLVLLGRMIHQRLFIYVASLRMSQSMLQRLLHILQMWI